MSKIDLWIKLADILVPLSFRFEETKKLFYRYEANEAVIIASIDDGAQEPICIDNERWKSTTFTDHEPEPGPWTEFYLLTGLISRFLLEHNRCVFHSVAFSWHGYAWLLCAPSGTGKTTQWRNWHALLDHELSLICGDKPILSIENDEIMVYSSPWNGKEQYEGNGYARLGGIIYLEQADHNEIHQVSAKEMVLPIFDEFLFFAEYEKEIRAVADMEDYMLRHVPVWKLHNLGDLESTRLTQKILFNYINEKLVNLREE